MKQKVTEHTLLHENCIFFFSGRGLKPKHTKISLQGHDITGCLVTQKPAESVQGVVSGHRQVEARLTDVSLHPVNRLAGSSAQQTGVEQLDDIWGARLEKKRVKTMHRVCGPHGTCAK